MQHAKNSKLTIFLLVLFINIAVAACDVVMSYNSSKIIKEAFEKLDQQGALVPTWVVEAKPFEIEANQPANMEKVMTHLNNVGYANLSRRDGKCLGQSVGQPKTYCRSNETLFITPSASIYPSLKLAYDTKRKTLKSIVDTKNSQPLQKASLESARIFELEPYVKENQLNQVQSTHIPIRFGSDIKREDLFIKFLLWMEDRDFFKHNGISYRGIARALMANITGRKDQQTQGGSTITAQLCKQIFSKGKYRSMWVKAQEFYCSAELEEYLTTTLGSKDLAKDKILDLYINLVPISTERPDLQNNNRIPEVIIGFGTASKLHFGKNLRDLSLLETAALLISVPSPERIAKQASLMSMRDDSMKSFAADNAEYREELKSSLNRQVQLNFRADTDLKTDDAIAKKIKNDLREKNLFAIANKDKNVTVITTIDWQMQTILANTIEPELKSFKNTVGKSVGKRVPFETQTDLLIADSNSGEILNFLSLKTLGNETVPNFSSVEDPLKPGSSIKPLFITEMIDKRFWTMDSIVDPSQCRAKDGWVPDDAVEYSEPDTVRNWLMQSNNPFMNCACAKLSPEGGSDSLNHLFNRDDKMLALIQKEKEHSGGEHRCRMFWGISPESLTTIFDLAGAYTIFPSGVRKQLTYLKKIYVDGVEQKFAAPSQEKLFSPEAASVVAETLRAFAVRKLGTEYGGSLMAKTGSTSYSYIFVVVSPQVVFLVQMKIIPKTNDFDIDLVNRIYAGNVAVPLMKKAVDQVHINRPQWLKGNFNNDKIVLLRVKDGCVTNDETGEITAFLLSTQPSPCAFPR